MTPPKSAAPPAAVAPSTASPNRVNDPSAIEFSGSPLAHLLIDAGGIRDANKAARQVFRWPDDLPAALSVEELHPEYQPDGSCSAERWDSEIAVVLDRRGDATTNLLHRFRWTFRRFDGEPLPCQVLLSSPANSCGDRRVRVVAVLITDREIAESPQATPPVETKEESDSGQPTGDLASLMTAMGSVIWVHDVANKSCVSLSPGGEGLWNLARERATRSPEDRTEFVHLDDRDMVRRAYSSAEHGEPFDIEYRVVTGERSTRWVRERGYPIRLADGTVTRVTGMAENTTAHRRDRESVKRELERNRVMLRTLELGLSVASISELSEFVTREARTLVGAHQAMTMFTRSDTWQQTVYGVSLSERYASYRRKRYVLDGSGISQDRAPLRRSTRKTAEQLEHDSTFRPSQAGDRLPPLRGWLACPLLSREGGNLGVIQLSDKFEGDFDSEDQVVLVQFSFIVSLAVERLRVEESLRRQTSFLTQSNQDLEQFAYVASHDLQEPLRAIAGYCQFLKEDYGASLDDEANRFIDVTINAAQRMKRLIDALLQFSRVGREESDFEEVAMDEVLRDVLEQLQPRIDQYDAAVFATSLPTCMGSRIRLTQLMQNLISNALKYRSERSCEIYIDATESPEYWTIRVHDNGIGIGAGFEEEVFRVFRRLHTHDRIPGTGIGLAICKRIVERHGGRIWVDSVEGQGSTFAFQLKRRLAVASSPDERS